MVRISTSAFMMAIVMGASPASGAEEAVCRPYATALTDQLIKYIWNRAFGHCLLAEQGSAPELPKDWQSAMQIVLPDATPIMPLDRTDVAEIAKVPAAGSVPATDRVKPLAEPVKPTPVQPVAAPAKPLHDAAALAKCARVHPHGYDARTGTFNKLIGGKWTRIPCQG